MPSARCFRRGAGVGGAQLGPVPGRRPGLQLGGMARPGSSTLEEGGRAENDYENEERERSMAEEWPMEYTEYTEKSEGERRREGRSFLTTKDTKHTKSGGREPE